MAIKENNSFKVEFKCYSVSNLYLEKKKTEKEVRDIELSDRIILPQKALDRLVRFNIQSPYYFKIIATKSGLIKYGGISGYSNDNRNIYMPSQMMKELYLQDGDKVLLTSVHLKNGEFVKFKCDVSFSKLPDPLVILMHKVKKLHTFKKGDIIPIDFVDQHFDLEITELQPEDVVSIVDTNIKISFEFTEKTN